MIYCRSQADVDSFPFVSTHNRHHLWRLSIPAKAIRWMLRCSNVVDTIHIVRHTYRFRWSSQTLLSPKQRQWEVQQTIDAIIRAKQSAANLWTASFSQSKLNVICLQNATMLLTYHVCNDIFPSATIFRLAYWKLNSTCESRALELLGILPQIDAHHHNILKAS